MALIDNLLSTVAKAIGVGNNNNQVQPQGVPVITQPVQPFVPQADTSNLTTGGVVPGPLGLFGNLGLTSGIPNIGQPSTVLPNLQLPNPLQLAQFQLAQSNKQKAQAATGAGSNNMNIPTVTIPTAIPGIHTDSADNSTISS